MRYKITLSYDGTNYCGWQTQKDKPTLQQTIEDALLKLFGENITVKGSGRTDAGVHALAQVAHFDAQKQLPEQRISGALNYYLPQDIRISNCEIVNEDFDARKSVKKKTYMYLMYKSKIDNPLLRNRALRIDENIDLKSMQNAACELVGTFDFSAFKKTGSSVKNFVRTVFESRLEADDYFIKYFISANGFLYNMVRIITAQLLKAAKGKQELSIVQILNSKDRSMAKETAPPYGLYLYDVEY